MTPQATTKTMTAKPPAAASGTTAAQPFTGDMAQPPVRVQGLVKRFGRFRALDHLDLEV